MNKQAKIFWFAAACTVLWMWFMRAYTPSNIIQFELAQTIDRANEIISAWSDAGVAKARVGIYLDFVFLILYSWSIGAGCSVSAAFSDIGLFKNASMFFTRAVWFAGCCDLLENLAMLFTLSEMNELTVSMAYYFAIIKFLIVIIALLFILLAASVGVFRPFLRK